MNGPSSRFNWVTDHLAIGSAPMSYEDLDAIKAQGITCILNLCAEFTDLHWIEADAGFETYHLPIVDERTPNPELLEKALEWVDEAIFLGKKVLIHCRFGVGRTGTVLTAYLIRRGFSRRMAEKRLKQVKAGPGNFSQWWFLRGYGKRLGSLVIREPALERAEGVDLSGFFAEYERLVEDYEARIGLAALKERCGQDHARCCTAEVELGPLESVYLAHKSQLVLAREERAPAVARAANTVQALNAGRPGGQLACPLSEYGQCILYDFRPLACRLSDAPPRTDPGEQARLEESLALALRDLSCRLLAELAPEAPQCRDLRFPLAKVVSGAYVQVFFEALLDAKSCAPGG